MLNGGGHKKSKWFKMPFIGKSKQQEYEMTFESEHLKQILECFKKVRLQALEKEEEINQMV